MNTHSDMSMTVVLVDDDEQILLTAGMFLKGRGFTNVVTLSDGLQLLPLLHKTEKVGAIVLDLNMPNVSGMDLLGEAKYTFPGIPIIIMTGMNEIDTAVECMKRGAFDYLVKPVDMTNFFYCVKRALDLRALEGHVDSLKEQLLSRDLKQGDAFSAIITKSPRMHAIFQYMEAVAGTHQPVLITGETGVGKELMAKAIHALSGARGSFVAVNVAGLDDNVFSDTLFGHRKGAYTGADQNREGLLVQGSGGTVFLDEIGDMSPLSQVKLLRLIQEHEYYPLGSDRPMRNDARIVVATNQDLEKAIRDGRFRNDLFYRLRTHHVAVPSLRERPEDLALLVEHFAEKSARGLGRKKPAYPPQLITLLSGYAFPGNVRELETMVFDAITRHKGGMLSMASFKNKIGETMAVVSRETGEEKIETALVGTFGKLPTLKEAEDYLVAEALRISQNNQGLAASLLGISRQALNKRLKRTK